MEAGAAKKKAKEPNSSANGSANGDANGFVSEERFHDAVPSINAAARTGQVIRQQAKEIAAGAMSRVPGVDSLVNRPGTQPLRSSSLRMYHWWRKPYGSHNKPQSVGEVPWDYVEEHQDEIPFLGLREYWYPALKSTELRHNHPKPFTLLGDNVVFFRDAEGQPRALENRCPHRGPLLSLGQVGVFEPGTITCRYHGMTLNGDGECVAFLAEGPNSRMCGKAKARSYPVEEHGGVIWVYMGDREPPSFLDWHPHARQVLGQEHLFLEKLELPFSHLNILDNACDLAHTSCLHRTCLLFADQKPYGELKADEIEDGKGLHVHYKEQGEHPGEFHIDTIEWFLPNHVYHAPDDLGPAFGAGYFWFVPKDVASFTGFFILGIEDQGGPVRNKMVRAGIELMWSRFYPFPGTISSCLQGGDGPMMNSQGVVPRWDKEHLSSTDVGTAKARRLVKAAHKVEETERAERAKEAGIEPQRIQRPTAPAQ